MKRILFIIMCFVPVILMGQNTLAELRNIHQVQKGETIQSIALQYGLTEEALLSANPDLNVRRNGKLRKGTFLTIPQPPRVVETPVVQAQEEAPVQIQTSFRSLKVGVLLPLEERTSRTEKLLEFYQGILMAADSVKRQGTNMDIYTFHCGSTAADMKKLLAREQVLNSLQVIFGPADEAQIPALADFCNEHNIRLVLPFSNSQPTKGNPLMYSAVSGQPVSMTEAVLLSSKVHKGYNYIILKTESPDARGRQFTELLKQDLHTRGITPKVLDIEADSLAYVAAFSQFQGNCVVPDNTDLKTLNILSSKMDAFLQLYPQYKFCLLGYPEWRTYTNIMLNNFHRFDTYIYSTYYYNPTSAQTDVFQKQFFHNFGHPMQVSYPRYAMMGFDMAYYFLHGISVQGDTFENMQQSLIYQPFQHPFKFKREGDGNGFTNRFVQLIHYSPDKQIQLIR